MTDKKSTSKTKALTPAQEKQRAIEIFQQAVNNLQKAGIEVIATNQANMYAVILMGYNERDGNIEKCVS